MVKNHMNLLVRADAGPTVGTGHVMRTLALGQAWKRLGGTVTFACGQLPRGLIKRIESEKMLVYQTQHCHCDENDAKNLAEIAATENPTWIVLDGYRFDDAYQHHLRCCSSKLLVIDDYGHASHHQADFVLNQNVYADRASYSGLNHTRVFAGPEFVLMRTEFTGTPSVATTSKRTVKQARRILVTFGGADPDNWTLKTLQTLSDLNQKRLVVDCVIGACYQHAAELEMFKNSTSMNLRIHRNVDRMASLMSRVDMAITAGGSTCYELAHCGVPSIVMSIAENQKPIAQALNDRNVMFSIDQLDAEFDFGKQGEHLKRAIRQLINDPVRRQQMSERGKQLVDGRGARRIAENLIDGCFTLRNVQISDSETTWRWHHDPEVRSVALAPLPESFEQHSVLVQHQIDNPQTEVWISEGPDGNAVGQVSFEITSDHQTAYIDIIVDEKHRGRGVGSILISDACHQMFEKSEIKEIVAQIKPGNAASEKAFRSAGFQSIEPVVANGRVAIQFLKTRERSRITNPHHYRKSA